MRFGHIFPLSSLNVLIIIHTTSSWASNPAFNIPDADCTGSFGLCTDQDKEALGRDAIRAIHEHLDDDKDGILHANESFDFVVSELGGETTRRIVPKVQLDNLTVDKFWEIWSTSDVYRWTTDNVCKWISHDPILKIYVDNFKRNHFDGRLIPRLAANKNHYLTNVMQIKDPRHKKKISLMAMELVLFGPPQKRFSSVEIGMIISTSICIILGIVYVRSKAKSGHIIDRIEKELLEMKKRNDDIGKLRNYSRRISLYKTNTVDSNEHLMRDVSTLKTKASQCSEQRSHVESQTDRMILYEEELKILGTIVSICEKNVKNARISIHQDTLNILARIKQMMYNLFEYKRLKVLEMYKDTDNLMNRAMKKHKYLSTLISVVSEKEMEEFDQRLAEAKKTYSELKSTMEECNSMWEQIAETLEANDMLEPAPSYSLASLLSKTHGMESRQGSQLADERSNNVKLSLSSKATGHEKKSVK